MKHRTFITALCGLAFLGLVLSGCETTGDRGPGTGPEPKTQSEPTALKAGELIQITYSSPSGELRPFEGRIKEDGTITLMENQQFTAAGKTEGRLELEIRERYVPRFFAGLTATVKAVDRCFYVEGQVRMPNRIDYRGNITVLGAISAAQGLTEFAAATKVQVIRANNTIEVVNLDKAKKNPKYDIQIYPNDRVVVPRKVW